MSQLRAIKEPTVNLKTGLSPRRVATAGLRAAEKLVFVFLTYAVVASMVFPLSLRQRLAVVGLNVAAGAILVLLSRRTDQQSSVLLAAIRDWFPCVLILLAYRESGLFFIPDPSYRLNYLFMRWDSVVLKNPWVLSVLSLCFPWLQYYLEFSYFMCYPLVPLGLGSIYLAHARSLPSRGFFAEAEKSVNHFWTAVLLAVLTCYVLFPFFPSTPPRVLFQDFLEPAVRPFFRQVNFWVLGHYGIHSSVFPSGHVAAAVATALVVRSQLPRLGVVFLIAAVSVAAATIYGRYHYAADAVAGAAIGWVAFLISNRIHKSSAKSS